MESDGIGGKTAGAGQQSKVSGKGTKEQHTSFPTGRDKKHRLIQNTRNHAQVFVKDNEN
jgi:hypothetical protein